MSTQSEHKPIKYDLVKIPTELIEQQKDVTQFMDIVFVNDMPMLTVIDSTIR